MRMKLLTHNLLRSRVKGAAKGYPLAIHATTVETKEADFNPTFIVRMLDRIQWPVVVQAASQVGVSEDKVPQTVPNDPESDQEFLKAAHHLLLEIEVIEGELECPDTGRAFPIKRGIPNMLLNEDEV
ncbi:hypothetical protein PTSG_11519 [Salpingoeca rosetta]|uniref:tRNA methyltransferase 112 homolog n=1 Tax=Salpingoeca rosetta (strain ATCC 50818 / BSB-021) TaxID=946362 RepID=F2UTQ8_SALR5|nr:uncharacterized protein PTSG_11519 [Salpingoeca rosetta]EGD74421.1 hypothetical protein PTSG_11519 [Salpingoeca rosetta]|eukprot:XP_004987445.1 hypothetical protein PTSG_11519 [Salpingoeca rosetta]